MTILDTANPLSLNSVRRFAGRPIRVVHVTPALLGEGGVFGGGDRYALELTRHMADQTVLGLLARRAGVTYLPDKYVVATHPVDLANAGQVARHYVGLVKELFFDKGIPYLVKNNIIGTHA